MALSFSNSISAELPNFWTLTSFPQKEKKSWSFSSEVSGARPVTRMMCADIVDVEIRGEKRKAEVKYVITSRIHTMSDIANTLFPHPPGYYKDSTDDAQPPRVDWIEEDRRWMCFGEALSVSEV